MTTGVMAYDPVPPRPSHLGYVVPNVNGGFTTSEAHTFSMAGSPLPVTSGTISLNGQEINLTGAKMYFGEAGRELGIDLEVAPPDIPIDEARRIVRHRQRGIERQLRDD